jgi:hypothetical protein
MEEGTGRLHKVLSVISMLLCLAGILLVNYLPRGNFIAPFAYTFYLFTPVLLIEFFVFLISYKTKRNRLLTATTIAIIIIVITAIITFLFTTT